MINMSEGQSKGNELLGLRMTEEKGKSRGGKKFIEECKVEGKIWQKMERSLHSLNSSAYHSLGWKSLILSLPSPREQQRTANKWLCI